MKPGDRVLGVDDASFDSNAETAAITGVVFRSNDFIEDIRFSQVEVDGTDAVEKIIELHDSCNNPDHIKAVLVDGLCLAGFNFIDIEELSNRLGKPVITVTSNKPDRERFKQGMEKADQDPSKIEHIQEAEKVESDRGRVYIQKAGIELSEAKEILEKTSINGLTPEPIRVAHLIGTRLPTEPV